MATLSLAEITQVVSGKLVGDGSVRVQGICSLDEPALGCLSFCNSVLTPNSLHTEPTPTALLVKKSNLSKVKDYCSLPFIEVEEPLKAIIKLIPYFYPPFKPNQEISSKADIHPSANIAEGVSIGAFVAIGANCVIEKGTIIHPHVTIYHGVKIGLNCQIHSGAVIREETEIGDNSVIQNGAVIGADGFGYIYDDKIGLIPVPQIGRVVIGAKVDIGANSCIDRATLGTTQINYGTKIDNLVQIGHNTKVGKNTIICGAVTIAGSSQIGDEVVLGGGVGIKDHVTIADKVRLAARSGVISSIEKPGDYAGFPPVPINEWRKQILGIKLLPKMLKNFKKNKLPDPSNPD
jgi:UDP-3-O-[3-hydroxymyristoyl] glucosamine N-acyltransferase